MKFISLDTETTGIDLVNDQILEIALIAVDTDKPRGEWPVYHKAVAHDRYEGGAYAINLNARLFKCLAGGDCETPVVHVDNLGLDIFRFLEEQCGYTRNKHDKITIWVAGKNPHGFDIQMCKNRHHKLDEFITFGHRSLDPAILFLDLKNDTIPPRLEDCKERAGLGNIVTHNAKEDAFDVADLILIGLGFKS